MANKTGDGNDNNISGTRDGDEISGLGGGDHLYGLQGNDTIHGGNGDDVISGDWGDDKLFGDAGDDIIYVSSGKDTVDGGAGNNCISFAYVFRPITFSLTQHTFHYTDRNGDNTLNIKNIEILNGSGYDDTLIGDNKRNMIGGGLGDDVLKGQDGDDFLIGGDGHETMIGGAGKDTFLFNTKATAENFDTVKDFNDTDDRLAFNDVDFKGIKGTGPADSFGGAVTHHMVAGEFQAGAGHDAKTAAVRILYDSDNGIVYYDANGSKSGGLEEIADIGKHHHLTADNFFQY